MKIRKKNLGWGGEGWGSGGSDWGGGQGGCERRIESIVKMPKKSWVRSGRGWGGGRGVGVGRGEGLVGSNVGGRG